MGLDELLRRFEAEYLEMNSVSADRRHAQLRVLQRLADQLHEQGRTLDTLTSQDVATFIGADLKRGLHPNTGRKHMGMIRSFATWLVQARIAPPTLVAELKLLGNPRGSSARSRPKPYKAVEVRELKRLLSEKYPPLPEYGKGSKRLSYFLRGKGANRLNAGLWRHARRLQFEAMIALALEEGLRRIELYRVSIPAIHYDNDQVIVLTAKQGPGGDEVREVPYTSHARECVREWLDFRSLLKPPHERPWLQLGYTDGLDAQIAPMSWRYMKDALDVFGPGWNWHRLRHTAATEWLRAGVPLDKVCIFMGHSNLEQTRAYTEVLNSDMDDAFGKAEADFARRLGLAA